MTKKDETTTALTSIPDFFDEVMEEYEANPLEEAGYRPLKVYNVMPWQKQDPAFKGKFLIWKTMDENVYWEEITWTILLVRKYWDWWTDWEWVDDNWRPKQDYYFTNELDQWAKWPIVFSAIKDWKKEFLWGWTIDSFYTLITDKDSVYYEQKKKVDWTIYDGSWIGKHMKLYMKDEQGDIFMIDPKSSWGNYMDVQEWTLEHVKWEAVKMLKRMGKTYKGWVELSLCKVRWRVESAGQYYTIKWEFLWFVEKNLIDEKEAVALNSLTFNDYLFPKDFVKQTPLIGWAKDEIVKEAEEIFKEDDLPDEKKVSELPF